MSNIWINFNGFGIGRRKETYHLSTACNFLLAHFQPIAVHLQICIVSFYLFFESFHLFPSFSFSSSIQLNLKCFKFTITETCHDNILEAHLVVLFLLRSRYTVALHRVKFSPSIIVHR